MASSARPTRFLTSMRRLWHERHTGNYRAASAEMMDKARRINAVCERYQVPLKAAALQFIRAHPAVASMLPGARSVAEVEENVRMVEYPMPAEWSAMMLACQALTPPHESSVPSPITLTRQDLSQVPLRPQATGASAAVRVGATKHRPHTGISLSLPAAQLLSSIATVDYN